MSIYGKEYKPGDLVSLREKTRWKQVCPKLVPKWRGPYMVVRRFGLVYEILTALKVSKLFHFDLLKRAMPQTSPHGSSRQEKST